MYSSISGLASGGVSRGDGGGGKDVAERERGEEEEGAGGGLKSSSKRRHAASLHSCSSSVTLLDQASLSDTRSSTDPASMPAGGTGTERRGSGANSPVPTPLAVDVSVVLHGRKLQPWALGTSSKSYGVSSTGSRRRRLDSMRASTLDSCARRGSFTNFTTGVRGDEAEALRLGFFPLALEGFRATAATAATRTSTASVSV
mmetsp:Transcript_5919/g.11098  ORF Transcript_5919/g.11098 Transcript_5919/m.11098 type:complete len:201 (-) Transcript_5919:363-965(-)